MTHHRSDTSYAKAGSPPVYAVHKDIDTLRLKILKIIEF